MIYSRKTIPEMLRAGLNAHEVAFSSMDVPGRHKKAACEDDLFRARAIARLSLYLAPVDVCLDVARLTCSDYLTYREILGDCWQYVLFGSVDWDNRFQLEHIGKPVHALFLYGSARDYYAEQIEQKKISFVHVTEVFNEVDWREQVWRACYHGGLDHALDALAAGVPLEHVFPEVVDYEMRSGRDVPYDLRRIFPA